MFFKKLKMKAKQLETENIQLKEVLANANSANNELTQQLRIVTEKLQEASTKIEELEEEVKRANMVIKTISNPSNSAYY